jgi:serine/threonine-protein kinase
MVEIMIERELGGRYKITKTLGKGGMAVVYIAQDDRLNREVAVKVILPGHDHSELFLKRFDREARSAARLGHPNIIKVIDYGTEEGPPYLVAVEVELPNKWETQFDINLKLLSAFLNWVK